LKKFIKSLRFIILYIIATLLLSVIFTNLKSNEFYKEEVKISIENKVLSGKLYYQGKFPDIDSDPIIILMENEDANNVYYKILSNKLSKKGYLVYLTNNLEFDDINSTLNFLDSINNTGKFYVIGYKTNAPMVLNYTSKDIRVEKIILFDPLGENSNNNLIMTMPDLFLTLKNNEKYSFILNWIITYDGFKLYNLKVVDEIVEKINNYIHT
ncbi:hypothetical protein HOD20_05100, partial [archaeon]|nr:hypothetical protein [archaeon]